MKRRAPRRQPGCTRRILRLPACVVVAALAAGCAEPRLTEDSPSAVTVRYDGLAQSLDDATATAQRACAAHGKTAQLRSNDVRTALARFAHFNCV
jgi:hypothetical protein